MTEPEDGIKKDLHYTIEMEDIEDADEMFVIAKDRLLDINHWCIIAVDLNIKITLVDHHSHELKRKAHKGDYIRIEGSNSNNYWHIDTIEYHDYPDDNLEGMTLVTTTATESNEGSVILNANNISACFIVQRYGIKLTAYYKTEDQNDNTANWDALLRAFLKTDDDD